MESVQNETKIVLNSSPQEEKKYNATRMWKYTFSYEQLDELYWMICGLMNGKGGTIALGINEKGQDKGLELTSSDKDELEREMSYSIDNVVPRVSRISTLNFVSTSFREIAWLNRPAHLKRYVVEINVNPGNPARYYTRFVSPMNKLKIYVRTAAQIRSFEVDVSTIKRNQNQTSLTFEPEIQDKTFSKRHLQLNQVKSTKKGDENRNNRQFEPRCIPKNIQINNLAAKIGKKNEYINELIAKFIKGKPANLGKDVEDLDAIVDMLNTMEEIAIQTYNDFFRKVYDKEVKDVRYTH